MKALNAAVRLGMTIIFLGLASMSGNVFMWLLFAANLLLFLAWAAMMLGEESGEKAS